MGSFRTGILVASASPDVVRRVLAALPTRFPQTAFTYIAPDSYTLDFPGPVITFEGIKKHPLRELRQVRRQAFDVCVVLSTPGPQFRKPKYAALLMNFRRVFVYNENCDSCELARGQWRRFWRQFAGSRRTVRSRSLLFVPFGLVYLLARTCLMRLRRA
jgi:hypothetical protein